MDLPGPAPEFSVSRRVSGGRAVVRVGGDVDMSTADRMYEAAAADGVTAVELDLRDVTFFDSAAIHALVRLAGRYPGALRVLPSAKVLRVLDISGLGDQGWLSR